jgi:hypothetical protein
MSAMLVISGRQRGGTPSTSGPALAAHLSGYFACGTAAVAVAGFWTIALHQSQWH